MSPKMLLEAAFNKTSSECLSLRINDGFDKKVKTIIRLICQVGILGRHRHFSLDKELSSKLNVFLGWNLPGTSK